MLFARGFDGPIVECDSAMLITRRQFGIGRIIAIFQDQEKGPSMLAMISTSMSV
jgi:hypothetical protein